MSRAAILLCVALAGCSTVPSVPETVRMPVPIPCLNDVAIPVRPPLAGDADLLAMDDRAFVLGLLRDRDRLLAYTGELEALMTSCR